MTSRPAGVGVLLAAVVAGLLFAPVFTAVELIGPVLAVTLCVALVDQVALHRSRAGFWRAPVAVLLAGLATVVTVLRDTFAGAVPTAGTVRALLTGAVHGWRLTLDAAWPARPEPEVLLFVPLLVLLAAVLGVELLRHGWPLVALLPALAVAALAQGYAAATALPALSAGLAYCLAAALVLGTGRWPAGGALRATGAAVALVAAIMAGGAVAWAGAPADRPTASLRDLGQPGLRRSSAISPLDEISERLRSPQRVLFHHRTQAAPERWPIVVLDDFDGQRWTSGARYRRLGSHRLADKSVTVPVRDRTAEISIEGLGGPWLPTPGRTVAVSGVGSPRPEVLVDDATGTLVAAQDPAGLRYQVRWAAPAATPDLLAGAPLDMGFSAAAPADLPPVLAALARRAVGSAGPTFRTALALERYLRRNYRVVGGGDLPAGHGYPQLQFFLTSSKRGTSEQFATGYVLLARALGLPARLVVGFRQGTAAGPDGRYAVRNADALAWPEVRVSGVGWVPLDPTTTAGAADRPADGLAVATEQARRATAPAAEPVRGATPPATAGTPRAAVPGVPLPGSTRTPRGTPPPRGTPTPTSGQAMPAPGPAGPMSGQAVPAPGPAGPTSGDALPTVPAGPSRTGPVPAPSRFGWAAAVAAVVLLGAAPAGVPLVKRVRRRRRRRGHPVPVVAGAWLEVRDRLLDHGVAVRPGATVRELAQALPDFVDEPARAGLRRLGDCVDRALWSPEATTPHVARQSWRAVDALGAALARRPWTRRLRAAVALQSLGRPW